MRKSLLEIYGLAVCFLAVMGFAIFLGLLVWNLISLASPEFGLDTYTWERHQTDEAYRKALIDEHPYQEGQPYAPPEGEALSQQRQRSYSNALQVQEREAARGIVKDLILLFIHGALFFSHWKIAAQARRSQDAS
ncbi:MAG: hypothetical protein HYY48_02400 [Gammaproteobacteria bacterium]|nr:hypothetical protein [Gammaproteobacteria bacterium]